MKQPILIGKTDYTVTVFIPDPAATDGGGKTGLVAANLTASYTRVETDNDVTVTDVTSSLNDLATLTSAHNDWGWLEVSSTLAPGLYRFDIADAVFASGAWTSVVYVMITTSAAAPSPMEFRLVSYDELDGVRLGLTALPNAAAAAAGGLIILGSNNTAAITIGALTTGAVSMTTLATSGTTTLNALTVTNAFTVSGAMTITGALTGTNASNDLRGILTQKTISAAMDELAAVPAAGPTAGAALQWIFMASRNLRQTTATTDIITNNAGATIGTAVLTDDTVTFEKGEYA